MFYFCGEHFIAFKILACNETQSVHDDSVLFLFKNNNKLLLAVRELDEIIDTSIECCRNRGGREHYMINNLLNNREEEIIINRSVIFYDTSCFYLTELESMKEYLINNVGFEFDLSRYVLYDWEFQTNILFQKESVNVVARDERIVHYINKFYFDLAKIKLRDAVEADASKLRRLDIGGI